MSAAALRHGDMELTFESNFEAILASAKALFPGTRNVALVWESSDLNRNRIRGAGLTPIEVREASLERFQQVLGGLPPHTIAILGGAGRQDVAGERPVNPAWPLCAVASAAANSPTFMQGAHFIGCGIVGGPLRDFELVGRALGERIVSRLAGGTAKSETVPLAAITRTEFDGRQLERWRVSERALPPGSVVRFREASLWRDHREQVVGALVAIGAQTVLIVVLMLERRRRRLAEAKGQENLMIAARAERQVLVGTLAGAIAHELNQPLAAILYNAKPPRAFSVGAMAEPKSSWKSCATSARRINTRARCSAGTRTCCDRGRRRCNPSTFARSCSTASRSCGRNPGPGTLRSIRRSTTPQP